MGQVYNYTGILVSFIKSVMNSYVWMQFYIDIWIPTNTWYMQATYHLKYLHKCINGTGHMVQGIVSAAHTFSATSPTWCNRLNS